MASNEPWLVVDEAFIDARPDVLDTQTEEKTGPCNKQQLFIDPLCGRLEVTRRT